MLDMRRGGAWISTSCYLEWETTLLNLLIFVVLPGAMSLSLGLEEVTGGGSDASVTTLLRVWLQFVQ
ncbi:unnamed protein product [Lathyrus sativus]|nr:unnamed protein product [Lathyrus sativus]